MTLSARTAANLRTWLLVTAISAAVGVPYVFVLSAVYGFPFGTRAMLNGAGYGTLIGGSVFAFQLFYVQGPSGAWIRRAPFIVALTVRTVVASVLIVLAVLIGRLTLPTGDLSPELALGSLVRDYVFSVCVFITLFFVLQMRRIIGGRVLTNMVLGLYHRPVREDRIFLFIDLADSTALAERLGDEGVHALISQFFFDLDQATLEHGGETHRYIGDEVVVTWPMAEGLEHARCLRCVFAMTDLVAARADVYRRRFGVVPAFRAALHGGPVVAGECGDSKQEIVYFGDTVNTAARIERACKQVNRPLLISAELLARLRLPDDMRAESLGAVRLRGQDHDTELFAVSRPEVGEKAA